MSRLLFALLLAVPAAFPADWNPRLAADYLDARQKAWFEWPRAKKAEGACLSCHTNMTYMLVRPGLRRALGETQPTAYEQGFSRSLRAQAAKSAPDNPAALDGYGTDSVLIALMLSAEDGASPGTDTKNAFQRMWAAQQPDGGWKWYSLNDDPWEMPESRFFGSALAAVAAGSIPAANRPSDRVAQLTAFLSKDEGQPLQNRLALLWSGAKLPEILSAARKKAILDQARMTQAQDGGWTLASFGPWKAHPGAPVSEGSNAYATAFTAFMLEQGGVSPSDPMLSRALAWLRSHQDAQGYWDASSMNHKYESGSMMELFMRDAATGYATLALLNAGEPRVDRSTRP
jgi:squalene-hopene/tetraprenyl-beta-curcumene cyclase